MPDKTTISSTSQNFLDIYDITNNIIILKNGSSSVVLSLNAMNFGLLAEQEQDAVIYSYAGLLNSLNFPIEIVIQSQTKDASAYLKLLEDREAESTDEIKKAWIRRYSKFVSDLIQERNVLDKKFFVVIPASALEMGLTLGQNIVSGFKEQTIEGVEKSVILERAKTLLEPKRDHIIAQFNRIGLFARQLSTQEIIRLFYTNYNPEATEGQQITNSQSYTTALVQAQIRGDFMNTQPPQDKVDPAQNAKPADDQTKATTPAPTADAPTPPVVDATVIPAPEVEPVEPIVPVEPATTTPEVNIAESPTVSPPAATPTAPMATKADPITPPAPAPVNPMTPPAAAPTVEITQPESKPAAPAAPANPVDPAAQADINSTLEELKQKPKI